MKAKSAVLLFIISVFVVSCFESPDFSPVPRIRFEGICFGKSQIQGNNDSLVISISFEDGDGNLGLPENYREDPFHERNYFVANNGNLTPVGLKTLVPGLPRFLNVPASADGKLVVARTGRTSDYSSKMVPYNSDSACLYYTTHPRLETTRLDSVYLRGSDKRLIDDSYNYQERQLGANQIPVEPGFSSYLIVKDTFYVERNPDYYNITVEFYQKVQDPNDPSRTIFKHIDWAKELCVDVFFDSRFPVLTPKANALSGTIKYAMKSTQL